MKRHRPARVAQSSSDLSLFDKGAVESHQLSAAGAYWLGILGGSGEPLALLLIKSRAWGSVSPAASACLMNSGLQGMECVLCCTACQSSCILKKWAVGAYIFETVEILVPLSACLTVEWLLLLHAQGSRVRSTSLGVHNGEGSIAVLVQLLCLVTVCLVIPVGRLISKYFGGMEYTQILT